MATTDIPPEEQLTGPAEALSSTERIEARLARIEDRVERGNREGRRAGRAFAIFAVAALAIALANLIAVAAKLDSKSTATVTVAKPAAAKPAAIPSRVSVGLREFSVNPSSHVAKAGHVTFAVHNGGAVTHEFVVIRTGKPAGALLKGARADETGNVGETGDLKAGASKTLSLKLKPGHYALICNLPGHYASGQHTDFTVR